MANPIAAIGGAVSVGTSLIGKSSANKAAAAQTSAANRDLQFQKRVYNDSRALFDPIYDQGMNALDVYNYELGLGPKPMDYQGYDVSPAAQYALESGVDTIEAGAAGRGGLVSGRTAMALEDYRGDTMLADRDNYLNRLAQLGSTTINAAGMSANAGTNLGATASNAFAAMGNAGSAGAIAGANAMNNGLAGVGNALTYGYQMNQQPTYQPGTLQPAQYGPSGSPF